METDISAGAFAQPSRLLSPIRLKSITLRNRIVMPAMHMPQPEGRRPGPGLVAFYEARARGGVGLIAIGGCGVDETGSGPYMLGIDTDEFRQDYERLGEALRRHGAATAIQLFHAGRYARSVETGRRPVAPSAVRSRLTGETPEALTMDGIADIIGSFVRAAERVRQWGFDAVEIIASAGYLVSQFLASLTNRREDDYGGVTIRERARFLVELLSATRTAVGADFPILLRLSGSDFVEGGLAIEETEEVARIAASAGVDLINVTGGWHETRVPQISGFVPPAGFAYLARRIRAVVSQGGTLVAASNRINDAAVAERLLLRADCDLVSMGRALIADPNLPAKLASGATIIPCIACNQSCFDAIFDHRPVGCLVNPRSGRELEGAPPVAAARKKVVVVGGGPAGCTAAITAAERGHGVTLFEKGRIGGRAVVTARSYGKHEWARLPRYFDERMRELGIHVMRSQEATIASIAASTPDAVIIATGAVAVLPPLPGAQSPHVLTADAVLDGAPVAREAIVIGGNAVGCEVALELALDGAASPDEIYFLLVNDAEPSDRLKEMALRGSRSVTLIEMRAKIGEDIGRTTRWTYLEELKRRGVRVLTGTRAVSIERDGVVAEKGGASLKLPADSVVLATGYRAGSRLAEELAGLVPELLVVGDAAEVADAEAAIHAAYEIARKL